MTVPLKRLEALGRLGACYDGRSYAARDESPQVLWDSCTEASWMLWLIGRVIGVEQKLRPLLERWLWSSIDSANEEDPKEAVARARDQLRWLSLWVSMNKPTMSAAMRMHDICYITGHMGGAAAAEIRAVYPSPPDIEAFHG